MVVWPAGLTNRCLQPNVTRETGPRREQNGGQFICVGVFLTIADPSETTQLFVSPHIIQSAVSNALHLADLYGLLGKWPHCGLSG